MPRYWPPRPSRFWSRVLEPLRHFYARRHWQIAEVSFERIEILQGFGKQDGVLIAPNHSHEGDAHVLHEVARRLRRLFYFMAAWEAFRGNGGLNGWILQRMGAFSIDREGCDRRSLKQAIDLLCCGQWLVLFPEGEIHHTNERLRPLLDGAAYIALGARRKLQEAGAGGRVWIVPAAIRYRFVEDVRPALETALARLERRLLWWKPRVGATLDERIIHFGEALLTLKEKEKLGGSRETEGDLPSRITFLMARLLERHEACYLSRCPAADNIPLRVKALRRRLLETWTDETADESARENARHALDDVQLVLQLYSYPGDYLTETPSLERMAETIEKYEEDIFGRTRSLGRRRARICFGEPIEMQPDGDKRRRRAQITELTDQLEQAMKELLVAGSA